MNKIKEPNISPKKLLADDVQALKDAPNNEELLEMLELLGADPEKTLSVDNSESIPVVMQAKKLIKDMSKTKLWEKDENGQYNIFAKITAITVMTASVGIIADFGVGGAEPTPYYAGVSRWLDIPPDTLRRWWKNQTSILREEGALGYGAVQRTSLKSLLIAEKLIDGMDLDQEQIKKLQKDSKGITAMSKAATQLIYLAKLLHTQGDLLGNKHLEDTAPKDKGRFGVAVVVPGEGDPNDITDAEFTEEEKQGNNNGGHASN